MTAAMSSLLTAFFLALGLSAVLTPVCRSGARRFGFVAKPREDRWHKNPTALFGGIAITLSTAAVGLAMDSTTVVWQLLACGLAISAFGLVDDVFSLKASTKLIVQVSVASALLLFGYRLHWTDSMIFDVMFTLFWIVGITNALNLLDNMDGLCAGITIVAGAFLLAGLYTQSGAMPAAIYLATLLGATSGFLIYNVNPASIFMGDTGSLFLGLNLAALTIVARQTGTRSTGVISAVAGPVLLLLVPIFDTTLVTVMRLLSGRRPSQGGRDHSSHRLVAIGLPESTAVMVLWALAICAGGLGFALQSRTLSGSGVFSVIFLLAMAIFAVYLARIRVYDDVAVEGPQLQRMTPLLADFMHKRRVAEVLLDSCLIPVAYYASYRLRFEGQPLYVNYQLFLKSLPVVLAAQLVSLFVVGGYRGTWRFFGMMDAVVFAKGVVLGTVSSIVIIFFAYHFEVYSRSVFIIYAALLMLLLAGTRASFRLVSEFVDRRRPSGRRCVIYGTSGAALSTIREAFQDQPLKILGFVDDDPTQVNSRVSGYSVLGGFQSLLALIETGDIECVVLNTRVADVDRLQTLDAMCRKHDVELVRLQLHLKRFTIAS